MKKLVLATVTVAAVVAAALVPSGPPVQAAQQAKAKAAAPGFGSAVSSVARPTWQTDDSVNALATAGNTVYAGGLFTRIRPGGKAIGEGEAVRPYVASFNRTTGAPSGWAPRLNGAVWSIATSADGRWVVIGGDFTSVDGVPRNRAAMFNVANGQLTSWNPSVSYRVSALAISGNTVYLGGSFGRVAGTTRNRLAAVSLNGALLPWNPDADDDVHAIDLTDDGRRVLVGGGFTKVAGGNHYALAMLDPINAKAYPLPAAEAIPPPTDECVSRVKDIDTQGNRIFVGNAGSGLGCYDGILAADTKTGKLVWQSKCLGATEAVKAIGGWLYKGSHAHDCSQDRSFGDGSGIRHLLVQSTTTGKFGPWFPNTDVGGTTEVGPLAFTSGGNDLWAGGDFLSVNGKPQQGLTRFTNAAGGALPTRPAAPKVTSPAKARTTVTFPAVVDTDNITLTYTLYRGTTKLGTWTRNSYPWSRPTVTTYTDTGVRSGQLPAYHVEVTDGRTRTKGTSATVRVR
ncbi:fibronectin type III domain-containing protein [Kribbella sp. NPDC051770]|uniref:fibronectin type III domain-containing protein n=1 Tax=Kribbella sp. NPDC051770 TaxID=3155413 RepID=UPI0034227D13